MRDFNVQNILLSIQMLSHDDMVSSSQEQFTASS